MSQRGFTLIEMAMVIMLIGLMVGGGLFALAPSIDKARINQTNTTLDQVESALVLFVIRNSRLPCPADGANKLPADSATYGIEQPAGGGTCTVLPTNAVIPWKTLGIDESFSTDGWGHRLSYWTSGMVAGTTSVTSPTLLRTGSSYPTGTYQSLIDAAGTIHEVMTPAAPSNDQAAYVLVSHGKSGWYGWNKDGALLQPTIPVTYKACNNDPTNAGCSNSFAANGPVGTYPPTSATYFDDMVRWRSPAFLIQLCGSGSCGNP